MNGSNTNSSGKWFLATIIIGIAVPGWETGHHVYVRSGPDGRIQVRGRSGLLATVKRDEAKLLLRTVRDSNGQKIAVAQQDKWNQEWSRRAAA